MSTEMKPAKKAGNSKLFVAYERYLRKEPGSIDSLFNVVREYTYRKVYDLEIEFREMGSSNTADDWTQEVSLRVLKGLGSRERTPAEFHSWVDTIVRNMKKDAFNELQDQRTTQLPFFYELEEEGSEDTFTEENPLIHADRTPFTIRIPAAVQGLDRYICQFIQGGFPYKTIGKMFGLTEKAVERRMHRLKKKVAEEKKAAKAQTTLHSMRARDSDHGHTNPSSDAHGERVPAFSRPGDRITQAPQIAVTMQAAS
jgi:RNA polymerase sigma factor (sigma-70 family)